MLCQRRDGVRGSRLCMEDLEGSSRMMRFIIIVSSWGVNQPFAPRREPLVEVGLEGMRKQARIPTMRVRMPWWVVSELCGLGGKDGGRQTSIRNNHRQPALPSTPRRWRRPNARNPPITSARADAVQKNPRRRDNSWCL